MSFHDEKSVFWRPPNLKNTFFQKLLIFHSDGYDEMLLTPNDKDSVDMTQDLIDLDLSDDDTIADYEPGGDD